MMQDFLSNFRKHSSIVFITLFLVGCTSVGSDYQRPQFTVPSRFSESKYSQSEDVVKSTEDYAVPSSWWMLYQDPVLNDLENKVILNNTDIKLAVARIEESDAVMREIGAATYPEVDLKAGASRTRVTQSGAVAVLSQNPRNDFNAQLGTSFEIDFWGKLRRAKESARAQTLSTRYAKETVALSLAGYVATNYLILRGADSQIKILQDNLISREASLNLTKSRLNGGITSALDVYQAEVATTNLSAQITELKRVRALNLHQLSVLTGDLGLQIAEADIQMLPFPPTPPEGLPSTLLEERPDIRQAEELMVAANANIGVAKASLYPSVSLTGSLGGESLELSDILKSAARIWSGGLSLNVPIFDAGRINSKIDQSNAQQKQALAGYESAVQNGFKEVNDALVNLRQNSERETTLFNSKSSAKKALEISENRYKSGYSAYLEVLDSQRVYNDAVLEFIKSRQARLIASVELFKSLGGGWKDRLVKH